MLRVCFIDLFICSWVVGCCDLVGCDCLFYWLVVNWWFVARLLFAHELWFGWCLVVFGWFVGDSCMCASYCAVCFAVAGIGVCVGLIDWLILFDFVACAVVVGAWFVMFVFSVL